MEIMEAILKVCTFHDEHVFRMNTILRTEVKFKFTSPLLQKETCYILNFYEV